MDKSRVEPTIFFIEKIPFSLKLFSGHFYGQSFIKTVRGPLLYATSMQKQVTDVSLVLKDSDTKTQTLSSLIRLSVSDSQNTDSLKVVSFIGK